MFFDAAHHTDRPTAATRTRRGRRLATFAAGAALTLGLTTTSFAGVASAEPTLPPGVSIPEAGQPMTVAPGVYSYIATHQITQQMSDMDLPEAVASLPVPADYQPANLALAQQFDLALAGALADPNGCLQIVVDPDARDGNLFNYGFFAVAGEYCP